VFQFNRKLLANGFLSGMVPLRVIPTGDFSTPLRCARNDSGTWRRCESYRWETTCEWFPVRHGGIVLQLNRKLFANSFLFGVGLMCFNSIGNCSRMVSYRHGADVIHLSRKLLANSFPSGMAPMCFMAILPIQIKYSTMP
jgi:hypothetical protein